MRLFVNLVTLLNVYASILICNVKGQLNSDGTGERTISTLEKKLETTNEMYQALEYKLTAYTSITEQLLTELKLQREQSMVKDYKIKSLQKQLDALQAKVDSLASTKLSNDRPADVGKIEDLSEIYQYSISNMTLALPSKRFVMDQSEAVAFHAVMDAHGEIKHQGVNQNLVFETVLLNLSGGYHNSHGVFTAPSAGVYIFSTSVLDAGSKPLIHGDLVKNGVVLARVYGHGNGGYPEQGSVTAVTQLKAGDEVWVRLSCCVDGSLTGMRYTSFTGALLMYM